MNVYGVEIPENLIADAVNRMKSGTFKVLNIESVFIKGGIDSRQGVAMLAADRVIQQQRKKGLIKYEKGCWSWVGE